MWGKDLRIRGRCPECKKRIYQYKSVMHSRRDMLLFVGTYVIVASTFFGFLMYRIYFN